jgi:hypothetical protein
MNCGKNISNKNSVETLLILKKNWIILKKGRGRICTMYVFYCLRYSPLQRKSTQGTKTLSALAQRLQQAKEVEKKRNIIWI